MTKYKVTLENEPTHKYPKEQLPKLNLKAPGRPREYAERMPRVTVRLDAETVERARWLGNGNLSKGLRIAVRVAASAQVREDLEHGP